ncbi:tripartite tricarboxylate transporter substrate binding protein [Variovorax sp. J31P179]|uniref:Bug family tripartite tricarboxylate transporter substrate binding protein n=1 Tax=Variovorax sp. J31P179 TaxID=3053508 RepID=UPI002578319B|nr:tripartite tricarboxylate transporter substrate binding protein [Variovorax sp. J31P179]MDM0079324.1 tripartite tricarboxylate transporter substrate binding protein [Variovorax sp. J31P179]
MNKFFGRRTLVAAALAAACSGVFGASSYPDRPIRIVVPFAAGGGTDIVARVVADKLGQKLGQPVVVINTPGAGGTIGAASVARAEPDGYTLLVWHIGMISSAYVIKPLSYDPLTSFTPIGQLSSASNLLAVNPDLPAKNLKEFIALAKANPGKLNYGSSGVGGADHLAGELLSQVAGINTVHVPYKGGGPATVGAVGGEVQFVTGTASQVMPMVKAGRLRALAVMQNQRIPSLPDVPTAAEAGLPELDYKTWFALWGPAKMPADVVATISTALQEVLHRPDVRAQLDKVGVEPTPTTPQEFGAMYKAEYAKWNHILGEVMPK